jgi:glycosyltransferase involved in cell wall biosynthesis
MTGTRRILFDGYWLADGPPSGRNVVEGLITGWTSAFPRDEVAVALPDRFPRIQLPTGAIYHPVRTRIRNHGLWCASRMGRESDGFDAVITQNFTPMMGSRGARRATFLHDAIFKEHPEWFTRPERAYLALASAGLGEADVVITSSASERDRVAQHFPRSALRVHPVGLAVPVALAGARLNRIRTSHPERPFILTVGRLNVRKNLSRLMNAFEESGLKTSFDLIVVGEADGRAPALPSDSGVTFTGRVTDEELAFLYQRCAFFVFPSLDEGFGLPLAEAAYFGAPSCASDIAAFREIGTASEYFDPTDTSGIATSLRTMATIALKAEAAHTVNLTVPRNSWPMTAARTRAAIFT